MSVVKQLSSNITRFLSAIVRYPLLIFRPDLVSKSQLQQEYNIRVEITAAVKLCP